MRDAENTKMRDYVSDARLCLDDFQRDPTPYQKKRDDGIAVLQKNFDTISTETQAEKIRKFLQAARHWTNPGVSFFFSLKEKIFF